MTLDHSAENINSYFIDQIRGYAIFTTDTQGIITTWNKGAERLKGYTEEEIIGQFYGILHPDPYQQAGKPQEELESALGEGIYNTEDWRKRKDGSLFWASVTLTPIFSAQGKHLGFTKITGDLSRQKELQDKLAEHQQNILEMKDKELQSTNLDLDTFIYTASHDLSSPITNIEALTNLLKEELTESNCLSKDTEEMLRRIMASVERFKRTIEDLTEISRLQKDMMANPAPEALSIKDVHEEILADLGKPTQTGECFIQTDFQVHQLTFSRKNFRSVLYNLLSNALKFHAPERSCIVKVRTRLEEPYVVLRVEDNGLGMNERQLGQLYTMFTRFHDHMKGTGVGLYMVKRIVENAGGKIEVESKENVGTTFRVYFNANLSPAEA